MAEGACGFYVTVKCDPCLSFGLGSDAPRFWTTTIIIMQLLRNLPTGTNRSERCGYQCMWRSALAGESFNHHKLHVS